MSPDCTSHGHGPVQSDNDAGGLWGTRREVRRSHHVGTRLSHCHQPSQVTWGKLAPVPHSLGWVEAGGESPS